MGESEHILITGITGNVGLEILRWFATHRPDARISCVIRASSSHELVLRWHRLISLAQLSTPRSHHFLARAEPIPGDITKPCLGLTECAYRLSKTVTHIIHAAANVEFLAPLSVSREINLNGTQNVLDFAARCARLDRMAHLSSVFIAGKRTGLIFEEELEHAAGFVSTYEQTKYEAELLVRQRMLQLPIAVYRMALLPGRAADGYVHESGGFHQALRFMYEGILSKLPGSSNSVIDLLPTDHAVDVFLRLFFDNFARGQTYHTCSGFGATRIEDLIALAAECFLDGPLWRHEHGQIPKIVDPDVYEGHVQSTIACGNRRSIYAVNALNTIVPHLVFSKVFDCTTAQAACQGLTCVPSFQEYFPRILQYCMRVHWDKPPAHVLHHQFAH